jgi:hypothetical protein
MKSMPWPAITPNEVRAGRARIIVLHETEEDAQAETERALGNLDDFLTALPRNNAHVRP